MSAAPSLVARLAPKGFALPAMTEPRAHAGADAGGAPALDTLSDLELVARVREGSSATEAEAAFATLVERYRTRIHALCYRILRDPEDAEDAAQVAFVKAYRRLDSFRGDSQFYTWLYRVAHNVANDAYQARRRRRTVEAVDVNVREPVRRDDRERPDRVLERQDLRDVARRALERVPPLFRAVLVLREYENLEYREIAEVLNISVGTVMSRLFRARMRFKVQMEKLVPSLRGEEASSSETNP
jgi:RNA polymerase sigma-70 factor (ECF subfamily)